MSPVWKCVVARVLFSISGRYKWWSGEKKKHKKWDDRSMWGTRNGGGNGRMRPSSHHWVKESNLLDLKLTVILKLLFYGDDDEWQRQNDERKPPSMITEALPPVKCGDPAKLRFNTVEDTHFCHSVNEIRITHSLRLVEKSDNKSPPCQLINIPTARCYT